MSLAPGTRLGPYEVLAPLGAGGMGEVYRALDTRLNRTVAIKVLAANLTANPDARVRFEREARAVGALDHPSICALYDVGEYQGASFLVMQYLEGETLGSRLRRGPLPLSQALEWAAELGVALDAAHRAGLVHRDVKPGNVMVTKSGVKLLDFGLARSQENSTPVQAEQSTRLALTVQGSILGTLHYMSPEQVEGRSVDARSDIFSLGAVVFEMITGHRTFDADSQAGVISAILASEPPAISALRAGAPPALDRVVKKCLAKDPDARWQSASDFADELNWVSEVAASPAAPGRSTLRDPRAWLLASALIATVAAAVWMLKPSTPSSGTVPGVRFTVDLPAGAVLESSNPALAFSPDGRYVIYAAAVNGERKLFSRRLDRAESTLLSGTEGASMPFVSADGRFVGYASGELIKRVPIDGGPSSTVVAMRGGGATWGSGGDMVFAPSERTGLTLVSVDGEQIREVTKPDPKAEGPSHRWPQFLPSGRALIFTAGPPADGGWYDSAIVGQSLDTAVRKVLVRGGTHARYVAPGYLVYARAGSLFAVAFDGDTLQTSGAAVRVLEGVQEDQSSGASQFAVSANGSLAFITGGLRRTDVMWVDRRGQATPLIAGKEPRYFYQPRLSPNGKQLAVNVGSGNDDIWIYDIAQETLTRLTSGANHIFPSWTPDGKRLSFTRSENGGIVQQPVDGGGAAEVLLARPSRVPHSWSPDGQLLTFTESNASTGSDIWVLRLADRKADPILQTRFSEITPMISPDGRSLAYVSDESGRLEVYVQPFPGGGQKVQISSNGGTEPLWARNGSELFFREVDKLMTTPMHNGAPSARPSALFETPEWLLRFSSRTNYDIAPDGQRFVMPRSDDADRTARIHVVLNWADDLKRLVPR